MIDSRLEGGICYCSGPYLIFVTGTTSGACGQIYLVAIHALLRGVKLNQKKFLCRKKEKYGLDQQRKYCKQASCLEEEGGQK